MPVSTGSGGGSANGQGAVSERSFLGHEGVMLMMRQKPVRTRFSDWPLALKSILGFWCFYALTVVARAFLGTDPWTMLSNKLVVIAMGVALTSVIYVGIASFAADAPVGRKTVVAIIGSIIASITMSIVLMSMEDLFRESREQFRFQAREGFTIVEQGQQIRIERSAAEPLVLTFPKIHELDPNKRLRYAADAAVMWLFFFLAWSAFYIATQAQAQALGAQRRLADAESAAQAAQVRALRYQVNPHFLFNTLNSLSALVMTGKAQAAEKMIDTLSNFYRRSLSEDPTADVSLGEEIRLQRGLRPVHPTLDARPRGWIVGPEAPGAVTRGEIAKDGVRLPHDSVAIGDHRHPAVRIHREKAGRVEPAKGAAGVDMLMSKAELADQPHHLLHVE